MAVAIRLDNQPGFKTDEIDNVGPNGVLAPEPVASQSAGT